MARARAWILDQLDAERSRWMLWLPVRSVSGIAVFELPNAGSESLAQDQLV